jgi:lactate dehydrogenase-like 2-hydroxyacid dehydrogenase
MRGTVAYLMTAVSREGATRLEKPAQKAHIGQTAWSERGRQDRRWRERHRRLRNGDRTITQRIRRESDQRHPARTVDGFSETIATDRLVQAAARADYLINVLPANDDNAGIFGREVFAAMKRSAYFINVGRGQTVDEAALVAVLRERRIAGAGLDVFESFPLPPTSPLWDLPNVVITPHIGGHVREYAELAVPIVMDNLRLFLAGRAAEMRNIVEHRKEPTEKARS